MIFPNFEKFKSLERINLYNLFDEDEPNGNLFSYRHGLRTFEKIGKVIKNSKNCKDVYLHGFKFQGNINEYSDYISKCLNSLAVKKNLLINGKKIKKSEINFKGLNSLELISRIEYSGPKIISSEKNKISVGYFPANIERKKEYLKKFLIKILRK